MHPKGHFGMIIPSGSQRIARLEQARVLNYHQWPLAAQVQARGHGPGFSLSADTHKLQRGRGQNGSFPRPQRGVGQPHDMGYPHVGEHGGDLWAREQHGNQSVASEQRTVSSNQWAVGSGTEEEQAITDHGPGGTGLGVVIHSSGLPASSSRHSSLSFAAVMILRNVLS